MIVDYGNINRDGITDPVARLQVLRAALDQLMMGKATAEIVDRDIRQVYFRGDVKWLQAEVQKLEQIVAGMQGNSARSFRTGLPQCRPFGGPFGGRY